MNAGYAAELGLLHARGTRARAVAMRRESLRLRQETIGLFERSLRNMIQPTRHLYGDRGTVFSVRLPRFGGAIGLARKNLGRWLERNGVAPEEAFEIVLACSEAIANAVEHPISPSRQAFELEATRERDELRVAVRDFGKWSAARRPSYTRGRGLRMIRDLMDEVEIVSSHAGTEILMRRSLRST